MAKLEKGTIFSANKVIDYADGGVISKELVHSNAGSVTLFSFDAGQGLSEHSAPFDALIQVIEGKMELTVEGTKHVISAGESFIIPSNAHHSVNAAERFKMIITMIRG
ncbi:cupin domain-containing protein [Prevotella vespertina]|uniref:Cupin domain-containing protein n=1 Tax=Prevotella vespertina TaxID=2608404 RepID=A0A7C9HD34_9BACT|nr:cupin domain-containing protein [Prevotella vespertina]MUL27128.1 cupin domain-containing protein [Prevotella vespertina]